MSGPRHFPALDIVWPSAPSGELVDRVLADLDEASPTAIEDLATGLRAFFLTDADRDRAFSIVEASGAGASLARLAVSDEAWAERSQAALTPIRVGDITVAPPWTIDADGRVITGPDVAPVAGSPIVIAIQPSMGFGTGHHQSTRLCLGLLQRTVPRGLAVLDVGTGSGVLAIAAWRLGADPVVAVDYDPDAITSARENVERNGAAGAVSLEVADIARSSAGLAGRFSLLLANLTGAVLIRTAPQLVACVTDGGRLIVSGFQEDERDAVTAAFAAADASVIDAGEEGTWVALLFRRAIGSTPSETRAR